MELTEYSQEPSRAQFVDQNETIGEQAEIVASILFRPESMERNSINADQQSESLHGAGLMANNSAESALFKFLVDTCGTYLY